MCNRNATCSRLTEPGLAQLTRHVGADEERAELRIRYEGPAFESGSMDVRQLAPSLLALAEVFDLAHQETSSGYTSPPALEVWATQSGSFAVDLLLAAQEGLEGAFEWVKTPDGTAVTGITSVAFSALGILLARKRNEGGEVQEASSVNPGSVLIHWPDGTRFLAPPGASELADRMDFRRAAGAVMKPLEDRGVDRIALGHRGSTSDDVVVTREDLSAFSTADSDDDLVSDNERIVELGLVTLGFPEGNKWRVSDGASVFWASLEDTEFAERVSSNEEVFARDDTLRVRLRDRQYRNPGGGYRVEHIIQEVIDHRRGSPPEQLPFEGEESDAHQEQED